MKNLLTIDVEDWFCVEAFHTDFPIEIWDQQKTRILSNIVRTVEILDDYNVTATFFVLGWIADKFPEIVNYLHAGGHEICSHSYAHKLVYKMTREEFKADTLKSIAAIKKGANVEILGYRAPSFSIKPEDKWVWEVLSECGFVYDSSVFPVMHDIYGSSDSPRFAHTIDVDDGHKILEIPPSTIKLLGKNVGFGGGGYLRLFPFWFTDMAIRKINAEGFPVNVYFHPWEIDPNQPHHKASTKSRVRHYTNIKTTERKLRKLLSKYNFAPIREVFNLGENKKTGNQR